MPRISALKAQKRKNRVNVFIDGVFSFGLDLDNVLLNSLKVGKEISEEEILKLKDSGEYAKMYDKLLRFLGVRPRSEKEIKDYFKRKNAPPQYQEKMLSKLIDLNFVNDKEFAEWWTRQRLEFKNKPKKIIKMELIQKGIARDVVEDVLNSFEVDEGVQIKKHLEKIKDRWKGKDPADRKKKYVEYLLRRGYSWEKIKDYVKLEENELC